MKDLGGHALLTTAHEQAEKEREGMEKGTEEGDISRETYGPHTCCVTDFSWDYATQTVLPNMSFPPWEPQRSFPDQSDFPEINKPSLCSTP